MEDITTESCSTQREKSLHQKGNKERKRFFADFGKDKEGRDRVLKILRDANRKEFGREVTFKDIVAYSLAQLTSKDVTKIKENSLSEMEKVERMLAEYNRTHNAHLGLGEFLAKKLKIS